MRHLLSLCALGLSVLLLGSALHGQSPRYYVFEDAQALFSQTRSDVDRAQHDSFPHFSQSDTFDRARAEIGTLQLQWDQHRYVPSQVDRVINALENVLNQDQLKPQDRGRLSDDLKKIRDFQSRHPR